MTAGHLLCVEYVRQDWDQDSPLIPCGRPAYRNGDLCSAHRKRSSRAARMDDPVIQRGRRRTREEMQFRDSAGYKMCRKCGHFVAEIEFARSSTYSDGLHSVCMLCVRLARHGLDRNAMVELLERQDYRCANLGCRTEICIQVPGVTKDRRPRRVDGVSVGCIDHDHACCPGEKTCGSCVRGLLCWHCNIGEGFFRNNPEKLMGLAEYVSGSKRIVSING